jgi:hypothetical protein
MWEGEVTWENYIYLVLSFRCYYIKTGGPLAAPRAHPAIPSFPNYISHSGGSDIIVPFKSVIKRKYTLRNEFL